MPYKLRITNPTGQSVQAPFNVQFSIDPPVPDPARTLGQAIVYGYGGMLEPKVASLAQPVGPEGIWCSIEGFAPKKTESGDSLRLTVRLIGVSSGDVQADDQPITITTAKGKQADGKTKGVTIGIASPSPGVKVAAPFTATGSLDGTNNFAITGVLTTRDGTAYSPSSIVQGPTWSMSFNQPAGPLPYATLRVDWTGGSGVFAQESFGGSDSGMKQE